MAKRKTPRRSAPKMTNSLGRSAIAGTFAYRFSGYTMKQDRPWWLTGVGRFEIDEKGNLTGAHQSAIMPIAGQDAKLITGAYSLQGSINVGADGSGDASILFTKTSGDGLNVKGQFFVTVGGDPDHLWLISAGAVVPDTGKDANESVTLEAVRIAD